MKTPNKKQRTARPEHKFAPTAISILLSFNAGFVDTAGFLGLAGLFSAHVTGNFVTLGAALVFGSHGIFGKLLALPEFIAVIALARLAGTYMREHKIPALRVLLIAKVSLLFAFFVLAVAFGPFPNADTPIALLTSFAAVAAMALQNAIQRVHLASIPPTTIMTGSTTQATLDMVDLFTRAEPHNRDATKARFGRILISMLSFGIGCACAALLYYFYGFWCLGVAVLVGALATIIKLES